MNSCDRRCETELFKAVGAERYSGAVASPVLKARGGATGTFEFRHCDSSVGELAEAVRRDPADGLDSLPVGSSTSTVDRSDEVARAPETRPAQTGRSDPASRNQPLLVAASHSVSRRLRSSIQANLAVSPTDVSRETRSTGGVEVRAGVGDQLRSSTNGVECTWPSVHQGPSFASLTWSSGNDRTESFADRLRRG